MTQGVKLGPPSQRSAGQTHRRRVAGEARDGGGIRNSSSGDQMAGGGHLRDAARRMVQSVKPGEAYIDGGELKGGGRSSDADGNGATVHGRRSW